MKKNHGGAIFEAIQPGEFYRSLNPGGFTDRTTGIHIPGPVVNIATDGSRMIDSIESMPDPIQLPHWKVIVDVKDKDRKIRERKEVPFDRADETPLHDAMNMALSTGIIEHVPEEDMVAFYPVAWKNRRAKIVYDDEAKVSRPMGDLIAEYHAKRDARVAADKKTKDKAAAAITSPPPPPAS